MSVHSEPQLVIFDVDATLIHSGGVGMAALGRAVRWVCPDARGDPEGLAAVVPDGMTDPVLVELCVEALCGRAPTPEEASGILERYVTELRARLAGTDRYRVLPGVLPLLGALRRQPRLRIGLGTGNIQE